LTTSSNAAVPVSAHLPRNSDSGSARQTRRRAIERVDQEILGGPSAMSSSSYGNARTGATLAGNTAFSSQREASDPHRTHAPLADSMTMGSQAASRWKGGAGDTAGLAITRAMQIDPATKEAVESRKKGEASRRDRSRALRVIRKVRQVLRSLPDNSTLSPQHLADLSVVHLQQGTLDAGLVPVGRSEHPALYRTLTTCMQRAAVPPVQGVYAATSGSGDAAADSSGNTVAQQRA